MKAYKGRIEGTTISVDNFRPSSCVTHYFLTHGHSDHCTGLTPTWNYSAIYCTPTTKKFILSKYGIETSLFIDLTVGERRIIPLVNQFESISFSVTPIDANHCPGAVCYLFEGYFGRFLCTGDFRYKQGLFASINVFDVDRLYLDDTYCSPFYNRFLTEHECAAEMKRIIDLPQNANSKFMIAVDTLGKERVFILLSQLLQTLIVVNPERYKRLKLLVESDDDDLNIARYFTTNPEHGFVFMVNKREISLRNLDRLNEAMLSASQSQHIAPLQPFVGILPSGWSIHKSPLKTSALGSRCYTVTYSAHSSFEELCAAVREIQPRAIIPIVADRLSKAPQCFNDYLSRHKPTLFETPPIVQDIINGHRNIAKIAVQHLAAGEYGDRVVTRKCGKRKKICSLVANRNHKRSNNKKSIFAPQPNVVSVVNPEGETEIEPTQTANQEEEEEKEKETQVIDLLTPSLNDDDLPADDGMDDIGANILSQKVRLVLKYPITTKIDMLVDEDEAENDGDADDDDNDDEVEIVENIVPLSDPPRKRRRIQVVISDEDDDDEDISLRPRKKNPHKQYLVDSQFMGDDGMLDDDSDSDKESDQDDDDVQFLYEHKTNDAVNEVQNVNALSNNAKGLSKIQSAKSTCQKRESKRKYYIQSISDKENECDVTSVAFDFDTDANHDENANWRNGIDFVATFSGTDGESSDFEDENLMNSVCDHLYSTQLTQANETKVKSPILTINTSRTKILDIIDLTSC